MENKIIDFEYEPNVINEFTLNGAYRGCFTIKRWKIGGNYFTDKNLVENEIKNLDCDRSIQISVKFLQEFRNCLIEKFGVNRIILGHGVEENPIKTGAKTLQEFFQENRLNRRKNTLINSNWFNIAREREILFRERNPKYIPGVVKNLRRLNLSPHYLIVPRIFDFLKNGNEDFLTSNDEILKVDKYFFDQTRQPINLPFRGYKLLTKIDWEKIQMKNQNKIEMKKLKLYISFGSYESFGIPLNNNTTYQNLEQKIKKRINYFGNRYFGGPAQFQELTTWVSHFNTPDDCGFNEKNGVSFGFDCGQTEKVISLGARKNIYFEVR